MKVSDIELEALRKFNSGKNAGSLTNNLRPGIYPVRFTVTLEGELRKGSPGTSKQRNRAGVANILRFLLDRINTATYDCLVDDLEQIREGQFTVKQPKQYAERLEQIVPYREYSTSGATRFNGQVIVEDVDIQPQVQDMAPGLKLIEQG